jgi:hypothetical protein
LSQDESPSVQADATRNGIILFIFIIRYFLPGNESVGRRLTTRPAQAVLQFKNLE